MKRVRMLFAAALVVLGSTAGVARAQGHGAAAPPEGPVTVEARAVDYSAMLLAQHGDTGAPPKPIPLADRPVSAVVRTPGTRSRGVPREAGSIVTDADGRFKMELGELGPGTIVQFYIAPAAEEEGAKAYYARPWDVDGGEPLDDVRFLEVSVDGRGVRQNSVMQVVTAVEEGDVGSGKSIQIRHLARVQNLSFGVWLGDYQSGQPGSFSIPIPAGFELRDVRVDGQRLDPVVSETPHGGSSFVYREALFPTVTGGKDAYSFSAILVGPYPDGDVVDISWHTDLPIDQYGLSLQVPDFTYEPEAGGPRLQDMGEQAPMGNTPKPTHAWGAQGIPEHSNLPATFRVGRPFPVRAVLITLIILLGAVGAALLGRAFGRRKPDSAESAESPDTSAAAPGTRDTVADLDARLRRGEITSVEHEVRRRRVLGGAPPAPPSAPPSASPSAPSAGVATDAERGALLEKLDEIVRRAPDAPVEQLRADLRTLARAIREALEG